MIDHRTPAEVEGPGAPRCSSVSRMSGEPMAGTAPRADVWVAVEHPLGWGDAALARSGHGVRILMARGPRPVGNDVGGASRRDGPSVRVWVGYATGTPVLRVGVVDQPGDVAGWDLADIAGGSMRGWGEPDPHPLLLVCANGRRDRCCGHEGGRLAETLWRGPHRDQVLTCTHLGGHRFAPTALLLPVGALHGRLDGSSATSLLADAATGRMRAGTMRGFSTLEAPAQVAEAHVRTLSGYRGLTPLEVGLVTGKGPDELTAEVRVRVHPGTGTGEGPDPLAATAHGHGQAAGTVRVRLSRTTAPALMACGRQPEPSTHWQPA